MTLKALFSSNYKWILFLLLISMGSLAAELINDNFLMRDFEVYQKTALRMVNGEDLYRAVEDDPYEHYVYKYSPPAAMFFIPLTLPGFTVSKFLYWVFLTFIFGSILYNMKVIFAGKEEMNSRITGSLILATIIVGTHFFRELHLGQVNLLLLGAYIYAFRCFLARQSAGFGVLMAASIFFKPFALIFIPFLLVLRKFKESMYFAGFTILLFILPIVFYPDITGFIELYASWIRELGIEMADKQGLLEEGNHTLFSVIARFTPVRFLEMNETGRYIYQFLVLGLLGTLILWFLFKKKAADAPARIFIILISFIPLLAFTSNNAFIFTLPLITYLLFKYRELNVYYKILFILSCILIGGNIYDLLGRELFNLFWGMSVYTCGTAGLLLTVFANWRVFSTSPACENF